MLDHLYAGAARARRRWYERRPHARRRLHRPVISIGNLTVGGAGKTPLVAALARWLVAEGERPAILSRGYGRRCPREGAVVVSDGHAILADLAVSGDEPLMLARAVPGAAVVVCADRHLAGRLAEARLGATVHLLDDGFQHLGLARDLDVLVTAPGEILGGRTLPAGRLREAADAAARAHLLVVMGADRGGAASEAWALGVSLSCGAARLVGPPASPEPVFAVSGIARPAQFVEGLRAAGWRVVGERAFADHHQYGAADVAAIAQQAHAAGASAVVTTEKDAVRFEAAGTLPFELRVAPLTLVLDPWDALADAVQAAIRRARETRNVPNPEPRGPRAGSRGAPNPESRIPMPGSVS